MAVDGGIKLTAEGAEDAEQINIQINFPAFQ
jgi:hypothetical protein